MMGRMIRRAALLATVGVLAGGGVALGWEGKGNNNGWDNKQARGCPSDYTKVRASGSFSRTSSTSALKNPTIPIPGRHWNR